MGNEFIIIEICWVNCFYNIKSCDNIGNYNRSIKPQIRIYFWVFRILVKHM